MAKNPRPVDDDEDDDGEEFGPEKTPADVLARIVDEIVENQTRLKLIKKSQMTPELAFGEMRDTVLSLLADLAGAVAEYASDTDEWADSVDDLIGEPEEFDSRLLITDAKLIIAALAAGRAALEITIGTATDESYVRQASAMRATIDKALARVQEITLEDEPEEEEEPEEDEEENAEEEENEAETEAPPALEPNGSPA